MAESYLSAEMQSMYSTATADWATNDQMLSLQVRVDLGAMALKVYSIIPQTPELETDHHMVLCHIQDTRWGGSYTSAVI